jgi:hypothetical protein
MRLSVPPARQALAGPAQLQLAVTAELAALVVSPVRLTAVELYMSKRLVAAAAVAATRLELPAVAVAVAQVWRRLVQPVRLQVILALQAEVRKARQLIQAQLLALEPAVAQPLAVRLTQVIPAVLQNTVAVVAAVQRVVTLHLEMVAVHCMVLAAAEQVRALTVGTPRVVEGQGVLLNLIPMAAVVQRVPMGQPVRLGTEMERPVGRGLRLKLALAAAAVAPTVAAVV